MLIRSFYSWVGWVRPDPVSRDRGVIAANSCDHRPRVSHFFKIIRLMFPDGDHRTW